MPVLHTCPLANGNKLVLTETGGSGGGEWVHVGYLSLVELPADAVFVTVRSRNVVRLVERIRVDLRHKGPRSHYFRALQKVQRAAEKEVARVSGERFLEAA